MNVVRHQTIGVNIYTIFQLELLKRVEISLKVCRFREHNLSVVTSLYDMMWIMRKYYTCHPWHGVPLIVLARESPYQLRV